MTVCGLFASARFTMATLSGALGYFPYALMEPILALRLTDFNLSEVQIGIFFAIWPSLFLTSSIISRHLPNSVDKRVTLMLSAFLSGMIFFFVGPSAIVSIKESLIIMGIGQSLVGMFCGFMYSQSLSEMISAAKQVYPNCKDDREIEKLALKIQIVSIGISMILASVFGAFVTGAVGFRMTTDIMVIVMSIHACLYFVLADGTTAFRSTCRSKKGRSNQLKSFKANADDNDFKKVLSCEKIEKRCRSSSGDELTPTSFQHLNAVKSKISPSPASGSGSNLETTMMGEMSMLRMQRYRQRLLSDKDGSPSPAKWGTLDCGSRNSSPERLRGQIAA